VSGAADEVRPFVEKITSGEGLLSSVYPCPETLRKVTSGSEDLMYDMYHGEIPSHIWSWGDVASSGISPLAPDVREQLIKLFVETRNWEDHKEKADLYKYNLETYGFKSWYNWCINSWGTKWDVHEYSGSDISDDASYWEVTFDTAWGPPGEWLEKVGEDHPMLNFRLEFSEPGMWFAGFLEISEGSVVDSGSGECDATDGLGELLFEWCEVDVKYAREAQEELAREELAEKEAASGMSVACFFCEAPVHKRNALEANKYNDNAGGYICYTCSRLKQHEEV